LTTLEIATAALTSKAGFVEVAAQIERKPHGDVNDSPREKSDERTGGGAGNHQNHEQQTSIRARIDGGG
jgi:hypothetical protein